MEGTHRVSHALGSRQSSDSIEAWARHTCGSWRVSCKGGGQLWLTVGATIMGDPGNIHQHQLSQRSLFWPKTWLHPTACRLQCWDTLGQITNRVGIQPYQRVDRLPKVIPGTQPPLNTSLDTIQIMSEEQDPGPPTNGQVPVFPTRRPAQAPGPISPTRG